MNSPERRRRTRQVFSWRERMRQAVANRRIFPYLLFMTASLGLLAGFIVTLVDRKDFPTFGTGVWWAIVTLGTVGYGDIVPHTTWGRVVGSVVILVGVTFISFLTATVTSYFVAAEEAEADERERLERGSELAEAMESLRRIERRLGAIESKLEG
jgi:voltage-gated potassium channel